MKLQTGKGVNFDLPPSELEPGVWCGTTVNFRSRNGLDEMWEGAEQLIDTGAVVPLWVMPYGITTKYALYASATKFYATATIGGASSDITRFTDGQIIKNLTAVGTTVTVETQAAHGLATTNVINMYGCTPTTYNASSVAVTVTDATHFTYTAASAPATTPATVFGAYSGNATSDFTALTSTNRYTGGNFNGLFLFNHPDFGLFYWGGDTSIRLRRVPGFNGTSTWSKAVAARSFKNFIVALGKTENGTRYPQNVAWGNSVSDPSTLPTTYTASDTNQAGEVNLSETAGAVVDCLPLGDVNIIYLSDARYAMQYIEGAQEVFTFTRLPGFSGLAFPNCVVSTPVGHVFLTPSFDVMVHSGGEAKSISAGRVSTKMQAIPLAYAHLSFLCVHPAKNEVWVCFPEFSTTVCDKALVWNYVDDTWGFLDLASGANSASGVSFGSHGQWPSIVYQDKVDSLTLACDYIGSSVRKGLYFTIEGGGAMFGTDIVGVLERTGLDAGDRDILKFIQRSRWNVDGTAGDTFTIRHGATMTADAAVTYSGTGAGTYTLGTTDYVNARGGQGRFLAIKLVTTSTVNTIRLRSIDIPVTPGGKR